MAFVALTLIDKAVPTLGLSGTSEVIEISLSLQLAGEQRWEAQLQIYFLPFDF